MTVAESQYSDDIKCQILARIAEGETLSSICAEEVMPTKSTVTEWALNLSGNHTEFSELYARARLIQAHGMADMLRDICDDGRNDWMEEHDKRTGECIGWRVNGEAVSRSRLRADKLQWLLSKALPKVYGDKLDITSDGKKIDGPAFNIAAVPLANLQQAEALLAPSDSSADQG